MKIFLFFLISFTLFGAIEKPTVMLRLNGKRIKLSEEVRDVVRMGVEEVLTENGYMLISETNQEMALSQMAKDHKNECLDDGCLIDAGGMLAARGVFLVEIVKIGKKYAFKVKYIDMETAAVLKTKSSMYKFKLNDGDKLLPFSKEIIEAIFETVSSKSNSIGRKASNNMLPTINATPLTSNLSTGCSNGMCNIPAGEFTMGCNDSECASDEKPAQKVYLNAFKIDQYEVTVAEFRKCVNAGKCSTKNFKTKSDYKYYNYGNSSRNNHPMNAVNWYGAKEYCEWAGKRLLTEAEWKYAAYGTDGRKYPWGNEEASCYYAVMDDGDKHGGSDSDGCGKDRTWPVGSKEAGKSPFGLYDMGGNVWEWVEDCYDSSCAYRVLRGGGWFSGSYSLRSSDRYGDKPTHMNYFNGFRCVK